MSLQKSSSEEIIELSGDHKSGAEHHVWFDQAKGLVRKIPTKFGKLWQKMHADYAERDLSIMQESGIPLVPTEIYRDAQVCIADQIRTNVEYLMLQQFYESAHEMSFADMFHNRKHRETVHDLACIGLDIRDRQDLGLDLLGGKAFKLIAPALNPRVKAMPAGIGNLLVADSPITATRDWSEFGKKEGDIIAKDGDVHHCDTRLFDFDRGKGIKNRILRCLLMKNQDIQDTVIWTMLESFGYKLKFDTQKTWLCQKIRALFNHALPKMQAHADAMG